MSACGFKYLPGLSDNVAPKMTSRRTALLNSSLFLKATIDDPSHPLTPFTTNRASTATRFGFTQIPFKSVVCSETGKNDFCNKSKQSYMKEGSEPQLLL